MAFDPNEHVIDPASGFQRHKVTGHMIGIEQAPAKRVSDETEYPKWVTAHLSHVKRDAFGNISTPAFTENFQTRFGDVHVLVNNEDEEVKAMSEAAA